MLLLLSKKCQCNANGRQSESYSDPSQQCSLRQKHPFGGTPFPPYLMPVMDKGY